MASGHYLKTGEPSGKKEVAQHSSLGDADPTWPQEKTIESPVPGAISQLAWVQTHLCG